MGVGTNHVYLNRDGLAQYAGWGCVSMNCGEHEGTFWYHSTAWRQELQQQQGFLPVLASWVPAIQQCHACLPEDALAGEPKNRGRQGLESWWGLSLTAAGGKFAHLAHKALSITAISNDQVHGSTLIHGVVVHGLGALVGCTCTVSPHGHIAQNPGLIALQPLLLNPSFVRTAAYFALSPSAPSMSCRCYGPW